VPNFTKTVKRLQIYGDLTVFKMAVRHLGLWKFKFFDGLGVKRPILHNLAKLRKDLSIRCCDIAIFVVFQEGFRRGPICVTVPRSVKPLTGYHDFCDFGF